MLVVPESALEFDDDDEEKTYVYRQNAAGEYERVEVKTGLSDGVNIEVKSGLQAGDKLRGPQIIKSDEDDA